MPPRRRRLHALLYVLPVLSVAVVALAILGPGADRPYRVARVYAGPTDGVNSLPLHLVVVDRLGEVERGVAERSVEIAVQVGGRELVRQAFVTDSRGHAWPTLEFENPGGAFELRVRDGPRSIATGMVQLTAGQWTDKARSRGGFVKGKRKGELRVSVAPERGVLAVPFGDHLIVEVRDSDGVISGAKVLVHQEGDKPKAEATTDESGRVRVPIEVPEHAMSVKAHASTSDGRDGTFWGALPVVPGALDARSSDAGIRVESPILREVAYVALLTNSGRQAHAAIPLEADGRGGSIGLWKVPVPKSEDSWCMTSSESDFQAPATVGWPLRSSARLGQTFAVADVLVLDGTPAAFSVQKKRRMRARWFAGAFVVGAALLAIALMALENQLTTRDLSRHLAAAGTSDEELARLTSKSLWPFIVLTALACVLLGFTLIALLTLAHGM